MNNYTLERAEDIATQTQAYDAQGAAAQASATTLRSQSGTAVELTIGTRANKTTTTGSLTNDLFLESDTGFVYRWTGAAWVFAWGEGRGTAATFATITVTAADNGAEYYVTDTGERWYVAGGVWVQAAGTVLPVVDTTIILKGSADATKQVRFEVDGLSTGATRVITIPDTDLTLGVGEEKVHFPLGIRPPADTATLTAFASGNTYWFYVGQARRVITTLTVRCFVATAAVTITWAEVAVFTGNFILASNNSLTRRGFTDVSATFNSTGSKSTVVSLSNVAAGDGIWIAFGSNATTPFQLRGTQADEMQTGVMQFQGVRPSTASSPQVTANVGATVVPGWLGAVW